MKGDVDDIEVDDTNLTAIGKSVVLKEVRLSSGLSSEYWLPRPSTVARVVVDVDALQLQVPNERLAF